MTCTKENPKVKVCKVPFLCSARDWPSFTDRAYSRVQIVRSGALAYEMKLNKIEKRKVPHTLEQTVNSIEERVV